MWLLLEQDPLYLSPVGSPATSVVVGMPKMGVSFCTFIGELLCHCQVLRAVCVPWGVKNLLV